MDKYHSDSTYPCSTCGKEFKGEMNLRSHEKLVHEPNSVRKMKVLCPKGCGKILAKSSLSSHYSNVHSDAFLYKCDVCGKEFKV